MLRGKKIDEADADAWIADAEAIIDTLNADHLPPHREQQQDSNDEGVRARQCESDYPHVSSPGGCNAAGG